MQRRTFVEKSFMTALGISFLGTIQWNGKSKVDKKTLRVKEQRIEDRIKELAKFGRDDNGHGYRVAFTKGDMEGRAWFMELMKKAGLEVSIDAGGNISGKRKGSKQL